MSGLVLPNCVSHGVSRGLSTHVNDSVRTRSVHNRGNDLTVQTDSSVFSTTHNNVIHCVITESHKSDTSVPITNLTRRLNHSGGYVSQNQQVTSCPHRLYHRSDPSPPPTPFPFTPVVKPEGIPDHVWNALPEEFRVICRCVILQHDMEMWQRGFEEGLDQGRSDRDRLETLLQEHRQYCRGKCPQRSTDLTESYDRQYNPFPSRQHLLVIFYKHFVVGPTLYTGKMVSRYTTIDG